MLWPWHDRVYFYGKYSQDSNASPSTTVNLNWESLRLDRFSQKSAQIATFCRIKPYLLEAQNNKTAAFFC